MHLERDSLPYCKRRAGNPPRLRMVILWDDFQAWQLRHPTLGKRQFTKYYQKEKFNQNIETIKQMFDAGALYKEMVDIVGMDTKTLARYCNQQGWRRNAPPVSPLSIEDGNRVKEMRLSGMFYSEIARELGKTPYQVRRYCNQNNIKPEEEYIPPGHKKCTGCKMIKPLDDFHFHKNGKDGYSPVCKECKSKIWREYRNRPEVKARRKIQKKEWAAKAWERSRTDEEYNEKRKAYRRKYEKNRRIVDPMFGLHNTMKVGIWASLKREGISKNGTKWESMVPYTFEELKKHLEKLFLPGMTWENRGKKNGQWNIEHKIPKSEFHFTSYHDLAFQQCWALENLRPWWFEDNMKKGAKIEEPFQQSLAMALIPKHG